MTDKTWVVTLTPGHDVADASRSLKDAGFAVSAAMHDIGIITGAASDAAADRVRALPGVTDVAEDQSIDIGAPDSSETW